jgi:hypothetical protein
MSNPTFRGTISMTTSALKKKFLCCSGCDKEYDEQENFARLLPCLHSLCNQFNDFLNVMSSFLSVCQQSAHEAYWFLTFIFVAVQLQLAIMECTFLLVTKGIQIFFFL